MSIIAFFDFDGTITTKDTLSDFLKYAVGKPAYYFGLLIKSPILLAYKLNLVPNYRAKEILIRHFFKGWEISKFQKLADQYSIGYIDKITKPQAMQKIRWHKEMGHKVVVVTASLECWVKAWSEKHNLDLIATKLETEGDRITGKFATMNCYGLEKVKRIQERYSIDSYNYIYAYGDSRGDKEMLEIAHEKFYNRFE